MTRAGLSLFARTAIAFTVAATIAPSLTVQSTRAVGPDMAYSISRGNSSQFGGQVAIYHPDAPIQVIVVDGSTPSLAIKAGTDADIAGAQGFILRLFPANGGTLAVGTYPNAHVEDDPPLTPRIGITAGYDLCSGTAPGWFRIDELALSGTDVTKLSATAVCQYSDAWTALEVRFHSTVPIGAMGLATNEIVFPRTHTGTPSDPIAVLVTAAAPSDLHPGAAAVAGPDAADFEVVADGCDGSTVVPGNTCEIDVRFQPLDGDAMERHAWLEIPDDSIGGVGRSFMSGTIERSTTISIVSSANPNPKPGSTKFSATMSPRADYGTIEWSIDGELVTTQGTGMPFNVANRAGTYAVSARYLGFEGFSASGESNVIQQVTYAASSVRFVVRPAFSGTPGAVDVTAIVATPPLDVDGTLTITDASTGDLIESGPVSKDAPSIHREDLMFDGLHLLHAQYSGLAPWIPPAEASIAVEGTTGIDPTSATHFFLGGLGSARTSGVAGTVTVIALDARGRIDSGYAGTVHVTSTDPAAVLPGNVTFAPGDAGRRIVPLKLVTNGQRSVTATDVASPSITGTTSVTVSTPVVGPLDASSVSVGFQHSCAVVADKTVRCWGRNPNGLLGDGTTVNRTSPVKVVGVSNVTTVGAGGDHTCALLVDRSVTCWGANSKGQLGDGTLEPRTGAVKVVGLSDVVALDVEASTTCAVRSDHVALCWGYALDMKTQRADPVPIPMIDHVTQMTFSSATACAIATDHTVKCWGANQFGQLGNGTIDTLLNPTPTAVLGITSATSLAMNGEHACALLADSTVRCWGAGARGETGDGDFLDRDHPVAVAGLTGVIAISGVGRSTCARLSNGSARCWGANDVGQLGDGTAIDRATPVAVPLGGTALSVSAGYPGGCAALQAGGVACWGLNDSSQIGDGPVNQLVPAATRPLPTVSSLAAYGAGTCALLASGTVQCWGSRATGELANDVGTASPVPVPIDVDNVVQIDAGDTHACARRSDGSIVCWGGAIYGQLGNGVRSTWSSPVTVTGITNAVDVSAGATHTCAALATGEVACWGGLGVFAANYVTTPELVAGVAGAVKVAVGDRFTCALLTTGMVTCWGVNSYGQLGRGTESTEEATPANASGLTDAIAITALDQNVCALRATHEVVCWGPGDSGQDGNGTLAGSAVPAAVAGLSHVVALAGGAKHACAVLDTGGVRCWGLNASGQLGDGTVLRRTSPVAVTGLTATAIAAGDDHTCAVAAGEVRCWGNDVKGQLGRGRHPYSPNPVAGSLVGVPGLVAVLDTPASSATLTVPIAIGVLPGGPPASGYFVSESATTPKSTAAWTATPPAFFALPPGNSERTLYAWIRSDTGEVSPAAPASIVLDLVQPTAQLSMPATTRSRSVAVTAGGTDEGTGIGAWLVTESPVIPTSGDPRWKSARPTSITLSSGDGTKHVYLWTRDGVRNVSVPATRNVRLDTKAPAGAGVPGRPAFGTGSARSKIPVRLRWAAATDASHAVHYQLEYQKKGSSAYHRVSLADATLSSATVPLAGGGYRFRVRALDAAGNASAWKTGGWSVIRSIQESASTVKLTKGFHRVTSSTASGGAVASATASGSAATIRVAARAIAWVGTRGPDRGIATVWVDGKRVATVDLYTAGSQTAQVLWQTSLKPNVKHTIRIVVTGTHAAASTGTRVDVDAFLIAE